MYRFAVDNFIKILGQVTHRRVKYRCNDGDTVAWDNFIYEFGAGVGKDFVIKFLEFGIQSWFNDKTSEDYSRQVRFNWVFGKAAIARWRKHDMKTNVYITRSNLKKNYKINLVQHEDKITDIVTSIREVEENFKKEFFNTKRGFLWCIANTTLYYHKSSWCAQCIHKIKCKELLKENLPRVYTKRGYER